MDGSFNDNNNMFITEQEDYEHTPENSTNSPPSTTLNDMKITSTSSPKRRSALYSSSSSSSFPYQFLLPCVISKGKICNIFLFVSVGEPYRKEWCQCQSRT